MKTVVVLSSLLLFTGVASAENVIRQVTGWVIESSSYPDGRYKIYLDNAEFREGEGFHSENICDNPNTSMDEGTEWISTPDGGAAFSTVVQNTLLNHFRRKITVRYDGPVEGACDGNRNRVTFSWAAGCYLPQCWPDENGQTVCWDNPPGRLQCPGD